MSLKKQILAALKTKYKSLGLSEKVLDGVAEMLAATTTEEENIETAVSGVENLLKGFQSETDARVTAAVNAKPKPEPKPEPAKTEEGKEPAKVEPGAQTDISKLLNDALAPLIEKVTKLEAGNTTKTRQQALDAKLTKANPAYKNTVLKAFSRMKFDSDEDFEGYLTEVEEGMGEFEQGLADQGLGANDQPLLGTPNASGVSTLTQKYIESKKADAQKESGLQGKQLF